jgi:hypothetical protein
MAAPPPAAAACLNCGHAFTSPRPNYCPDCGQESVVRAPTLREFAQQFGGHYLATEGALWRTLKLLFLKPGALTLEYFAGRRRRYVQPLRLYLTISLFALLALRLATTVDVELPPVAADKLARTNQIQVETIGQGRVGMRDGKFYCQSLPGWLCRRLERKLDLDRRALRREFELAPERFISHFGQAMFVLVPMFALWLKLAWWNRRLRYTEHLVFALHLHAYWFVAILLTLAQVSALSLAATLSMPVYALLASRRVYGGRWRATVARNAAVMAVYGTTLAAAMAAVALWTLLG